MPEAEGEIVLRRWGLSILTFLLSASLLGVWRWVDPRLAGLNFATSGHFPRTYFLGFKTLELFEQLHQVLLILGILMAVLMLLSILITWLRPSAQGILAVFIFSALIYGISGGLFLHEQSPAPHYVYLADAFLHGRFHLAHEPPHSGENDWTYYDGKWMVSFPPAPAFLLMPYVAIAGTDANDVVFTLLFGALNVALVYDLLPRLCGWPKRDFGISSKMRFAVTLLFGFGTVHWWVASLGQIWFTAQIVAVTFLLLTLRETLGKGRPILAATWLSLAALARPTVLLSLPVFIWLLFPLHSKRQMFLGLIPLMIAAGFMAWYNWARFGDPLELGYRYMQLEKLLERIVREHGHFNLIYLGDNLYYALLDLPTIAPHWPYLRMDGWGLSIFLSTPALMYLFAAPYRERLAQAAALAAILVIVPSLLYYNTGYLQAGYRYLLDVLPFLIILVTLGMGERLKWHSAGLVFVSIGMGFFSLVNFYGLYFEWF